MPRAEAEIANRLGLHARPSAKLTQRATQFRSDVSDQVPRLSKRVDVGHRRSLSSPWRPVASN